MYSQDIGHCKCRKSQGSFELVTLRIPKTSCPILKTVRSNPKKLVANTYTVGTNAQTMEASITLRLSGFSSISFFHSIADSTKRIQKNTSRNIRTFQVNSKTKLSLKYILRQLSKLPVS